ncbi:hypothetical protein B4U80_08108 [Leptotrombidium deliense]|uniref:Uncharacterized protein n=1 Tax=Leptotrombidium deliense TaxID=299467 RepID=A0A443RS70_9ACAR|nr:hypothetical protein B4U80_08108 [Leptotrombidium deliense]
MPSSQLKKGKIYNGNRHIK